MLKSFLLSASFLWRFPIKIDNISEEDFKKALIFFPAIGAIEGIILAFISKFLSSYLSEELLAFILLLIILYLRGIFHLDGFSDTFDALAYKGCNDPELDRKKRLEIMKDSRAGVSGIVAIFINLLGKFILFKILLQKKLFALIFLPFLLSRAFILPFIYLSKPAKSEGLGFLMKRSLTQKTLTLAALLSSFILGFFLFLENFSKIFFIILILCINFIMLLYFQKKFEKTFGGLTGDNFGALIEISEITTLFGVLILWPRL
ncbi:MAG: adenosylcobinamide-GDP ribazoletransferase [Caldimicrobium sp.]